jgi:hypothetical protein
VRLPLDGYRRLVLSLLLLGCYASVSLADPKPDIAGLQSGPIVVNATPIRSFRRFDKADVPLEKLIFRGGLVLRSPSPNFGGWSGLVLDADAKSFLAISDAGLWMTGRLVFDGNRPGGIADARLGPLLNRQGAPLGRGFRDAEALALASGTLERGSVLVAFEGRHRIERYDLAADGLSADRGAVPLPAAAKTMGSNLGLEAMTVMAGGPYKGALVAFSERLYDPAHNHTGWLWTRNGPKTLHLKNTGDYDLTDLASLDDGTLFVLQRRFRWLEGLKIRLGRLAPDAVQSGVTAEPETLLDADLNDEVDNMEGLATTRLSDGRVLLTMISDDNYNHAFQRTILLQFVVKDSGQAKARPQD